MMDTRSKWLEFTSELEITNELKEKWWKIISDYYSEGHRYYHTLDHIGAMLEQMDMHCNNRLKNKHQVLVAIFFHDIIYNPKARDNEKLSAEMAMHFLNETKCSTTVIDPSSVQQMILLTETHTTSAHSDTQQFGTDDEHYLLDLDMSILGQSWTAYETYAANIRREYSHIPHSQYCKKRAEVLENFLKSHRVYCTVEFHTLYEASGRYNIEKEIKLLKDNVVPQLGYDN